MNFGDLSLQSQRTALSSALLDWVNLAKSNLSIDIPLLSSTDPHLHDGICAILRERDAARCRRNEELSNHPAGEWLRSQKEISLAWDYFNGKRTKYYEAGASVEVEVEAQAAAIISDSMKQAQSDSRGEDEGVWSVDAKLQFSLSRLNVSHPNPWLLAVAKALAEYLAGGAAEKLLRRSGEYEAIAESFFLAAEKLRGAISDLAGLDISIVRPSFDERLRRVLAEVPGDLPSWKNPLNRRSSGQDEKLFVFRVFVAHRRLARSPRTEAIVELLHLSLFRTRFDRRHVDRLVGEFTAKLKSKKQPT